ncbi:MAG: 3-hydroxyacyl-CoA dehydrogenase family protein [Betaproteobacteria bacterium]|jgi:3-hydroxybutyryl-CoA dehydrogenase|nr:3-hydroxyacyl-CoA dehydrogenase family protein [Rhodocyclaceae bacterium]MCA3133431.1 3-hydroxyacyl-CoA dehydrogenase family protein [Rhodocyclaceae bacterium]MCA3143226.1 3-hydroxyacyl-CoA dehydrogenase family protein [Rhodocyclaceae bacterium]MCA3144644.1 3-hydroxyacyl-CoA dehydrogenase family protein [Rhodocyclaceae bacterium]MCE2896409.1 3-hydroxyacyl-CoA dehydrogenase family protein [Betaproteobacteria bacterium]
MTSIQTVGVVGAGLMGSEIALVCALSGRRVLLADTAQERLSHALENLGRVMDKGVQRGFYKEGDREQALGRITPTTELAAFADCDLVTEAVFEDESVKAQVFRSLDQVCRPDAMVCSNTSTISITGLSAYLSPARRPRFLGTHYFSPVSRMKLVEVIPGIDTDEATVSQVTEFCRHIGKAPIRVKDVVGFAVNRLLHVFMIEAVRLVEEGVCTPEEVDLACRLGLGHPVGPFELSDAVTNHLCLQAQEIMHGAYGERFRPRPLLKQMVQAGYDGKKAGRGWYRYPSKP